MVMFTVMLSMFLALFRPNPQRIVTSDEDPPSQDPNAKAMMKPLVSQQVHASHSRRSREIKKPRFLADFDC